MASFLSGLLGMGEQELRFHVQRANTWTLAPLFRIFPSLSPVCSPTRSFSDDLPATVVCDSCDIFSSFQPAQPFEGQFGEQTHVLSDALAFPLSGTLDLDREVSDLSGFLASEVKLGLCGQEDRLSEGFERESSLQSVCSEIDVAGWGEPLSDTDEEGLAFCFEETSSDEGEAAFSDEEEEDEFLAGGLDFAALTQAKGAADFSQLDRGCLTEIMSHLESSALGSCSLVCHEWLEVSNFVHTSLTLQGGPELAALPSLLARFSRLQSLSIKGSSDVDQPDLDSSDSPMPAKLLLDDCTVSMIAQGCSRLRALQLVDCLVSDSELAAILRGCPGLADLSLSHCDGFSGEAFNGLQCKLEMLEFNACAELTNDGLLAAAAACAGLKDLGVLTQEPDVFLARGLEGFASRCRGLRALNIHSCQISDETLQYFAAGCPVLRNVCITCEHSITDVGLADFFAQLPLVDTVTLQGNHSLLGVPQFGPSRCLRRLRLGFLYDTPDSVLQGVANEGNLEELVLNFCPTLTDSTVEKIVLKCKKLCKLMLTDCDLVTAEAVRAYVGSGSNASL